MRVEALRAGRPALVISAALGRAALWRAARSGLEGELVDVTGPRGRPAGEVVTELVASLRPQLEDGRRLGHRQRAGPAGADRGYVGGAAAQGVAPPRAVSPMSSTS